MRRPKDMEILEIRKPESGKDKMYPYRLAEAAPSAEAEPAAQPSSEPDASFLFTKVSDLKPQEPETAGFYGFRL